VNLTYRYKKILHTVKKILGYEKEGRLGIMVTHEIMP
jgi:hypothetical protein